MQPTLSRAARWYRRAAFLATFLAITGALALAPWAGAQSGAVVKIVPARSSVAVGDTVTVDIRAENVSSLEAVEIRLKYDSARLEATGIEPGALFTPDPATLVKSAAGGEIRYDAEGTQAASNNGVIFSVTFKGLAQGSASIGPASSSSVLLAFVGGGWQTPQVASVQITVGPTAEPPSPTPSPSPTPPEASPTPSPSHTPTTPPEASPTPSPSHTPTTPPEASATPSPSPTPPTVEPTHTPSATPPLGTPSSTPPTVLPSAPPPSATPPTVTRPPTIVFQPGLTVEGRVWLEQSGERLAGVKIYRQLAAYPGELAATTDANGYYKTNFVPIPGDEMVAIWAELEGHHFVPDKYVWRHYYGPETQRLDFAARLGAPTPGASPTPLPPTPIPPALTRTPTYAPTQPPRPDIGLHVVRQGETLFCMGRAYLVNPWAIARRNGLYSPNLVIAGQRLAIPDERWTNIPPGPICIRQFALPGETSPGQSPTPAPGPTPVPPCRAMYNVVYGDTLWSIARRYASSPWSIASINNIPNPNLILMGDVLCIP